MILVIVSVCQIIETFNRRAFRNSKNVISDLIKSCRNWVQEVELRFHRSVNRVNVETLPVILLMLETHLCNYINL